MLNPQSRQTGMTLVRTAWPIRLIRGDGEGEGGERKRVTGKLSGTGEEGESQCQ